MKPSLHISLHLALAAFALLAERTAFAYDNDQLRSDLRSPDPLVYKQATLNAVEMPTPETVRDLMAIVLSKDPERRRPRGVGDIAYGNPRSYAIKALSQLLPNPPATFSSNFNRGGMRGAQVYYLELFEAWWEQHRHDFEGKDAKMPERRPDSLRNLSADELEARERDDYEKSHKLSWALTLRQAKRTGSTWDEIEDEYLEERRQARAAERALAKQDWTPGETGITSPVGTNPPGASAASGATSPAPLSWIFTLGFLALVAAVAVALRLRRKHAIASA